MIGDKDSGLGLFEDEFASGESSDVSVFNKDVQLLSESPFEERKKEPHRLSAALDSLSEIHRNEALRRLSYIQFVEKRNSAGWTAKNLTPLLQEAGNTLDGPLPSWRTLAEWYRSYKQSGRSIEALIPKHSKKGNRRQKVVDDSSYYWKAVNEEYLTRERPTIAATYEYYEDLITLANKDVVEGRIPTISLRAFYSRISKLDPYEVALKRYGKSYADREFRNVGAHIKPTRILERVEIDHTPLDLILLDDELGIPLGRPYLTALIDCMSSCLVGFYLGYKDPSYFSVNKALLNGLLSKEYIRERYPTVKCDWPCEGKIETLVVDNGAEFWSESLEYACKAVVSDIQYNPVAKPWLKPIVERFFGVLNKKLLVSIPGKTFSSIGDLDGYDPQKDSVMRFSTFMEVFHKWIVDVYHQSPNSRETNIPAVTWDLGARHLPPAVYRGADIERLSIELGQKETRTLRKDGITFLELRYSSDELTEYRKHNPPSGSKPHELIIKINPATLAYIYVYLENEQRYLKVPCVDPDGYTEGLTLFQHQTNRKLVRNFNRFQFNREGVAEAKMVIKNRIQSEVDEVEKIGQRKPRLLPGAKAAARYLNIDSDMPPNSASLKTIASDHRDKAQNPSSPGNGEANVKDINLLDDWDDMVSDLDAY